MTLDISDAIMRERTVGDIAATVPGATAIFRKYRIDFCCGGEIALYEAAQSRGIDPDEVERALSALNAGADAATASSMSSGELIDHIVDHYHASHRHTIPELIALSRKVEAVHRENPRVPAGLAAVLVEMDREMMEHMAKEEETMFPAMRRRAEGDLTAEIGELRHEHDHQGELLHKIEHLTDNFVLPEGACRSWQALYVGTAQLVDDVMQHIHLENNVLFPRFAAAEGQA